MFIFIEDPDGYAVQFVEMDEEFIDEEFIDGWIKVGAADRPEQQAGQVEIFNFSQEVRAAKNL